MHHFHIPAMTCGGCLKAVTRTIQQLDPQARVESDLENRTVKVTSDEAEAVLRAALENAGYPAQTGPTDK